MDLRAFGRDVVAYFRSPWPPSQRLKAARYPGAQIASVEPYPANLKALWKNLQLNDVCATIVAGAATRDDGPVRLFVSTSLNHTLVPQRAADPKAAITVQGLSVPTLMNRLGWDQIDLLKIDIEWYESALFADHPPWLAQVGRIIGKVHAGYGFDALRSDLTPLGFSVSTLAHPRMFLAVRSDVGLDDSLRTGK